MGGESAQFLKRVMEEFNCVRGIMLSDNDGVLISQSVPQKQNEKFAQTTALLISALNQTQSNLQKTKTYSELRTVNFYYQEYLIHLAHVKNLMVTLFLDSHTNIELARQISTDVAIAFQKLNAKIPDIRAHCQ